MDDRDGWDKHNLFTVIRLDQNEKLKLKPFPIDVGGIPKIPQIQNQPFHQKKRTKKSTLSSEKEKPQSDQYHPSIFSIII